MTDTLKLDVSLPVGNAGERSVGWWGVVMLIVTEAALFGYLLFSYYYLLFQTTQHWPPDGLPKLGIPGLNTVLLLSSSFFVWCAERYIRKGRNHRALLPLAIAIILGTAFTLIQVNEWYERPYALGSNLYASLYFTITGFHLAHVVIGIVILSLLWLWTSLGYFGPQRMTPIKLGGLYWHFVDIVWIFIFSSFFLVPYAQS